MSVTQTSNAFLVNGGDSVALSSMVTVSTSGSNPTYLILTGFDRNEYTAGASTNTGNLQGNGNELDFSQLTGDARGASIVFTYQSSTKRYYNSTYGYLDALTYSAPDSTNDVTDLSLFSTSSAALVKSSSDNLTAATLSLNSAATLVATATVVSEPIVKTSTVPSQATPSSIAQAADSFIGKAWNVEGCWILASTVAAEAGASLPPISALVDVAGKPSGEWIIAYNGPSKAKSTWESQLVAGEMVVFQDGTQSGHIATVVSGAGASAMLVDNAAILNASGNITNPANDGSSSDIKISRPHSATQELAGIAASSVVVYELDTPIVTLLKPSVSLAPGNSQSLASLFHSSDAGSKSVSKYQVYDSLASDGFLVGNVLQHANSAATAITFASLSSIKVAAGTSAGTDFVYVRAFNGTYWGDWAELEVDVQTPVNPPVVAHQTPNLTWTQGQTVKYTLAGSTFSDPNHQALTYSATLSSGAPLPSWLSFDASTDSFSGTVPTGTQNLSLAVTATDTGGLSAKDSFAVTIKAAAGGTTTSETGAGAGTGTVTTGATTIGPVLTHQTASQVWASGKFAFLTLPANTFTEAGAKLTYTEKQLSGPDVSSWLHFNAPGETLAGWVPWLATGTVKIEIIATDTAGHTAVDIFSARVGLSALG